MATANSSHSLLQSFIHFNALSNYGHSHLIENGVQEFHPRLRAALHAPLPPSEPINQAIAISLMVQ